MNMRRTLTVLAIIAISFANTQAQNFGWARSFGGKNYDDGNAIATDKDGNVYITGSFQKFVGSPVDFDPGAGTYFLDALGQFDAFIVKLDAAGNFVWAKNIGGSGGKAQGNGIAVDGSGNVYTTGYFSYTADFDPGEGTYNLLAPFVVQNSPTDIFVLKLNSNGDFVWAKNIGANFNDKGNGITLDGTANVYVTGEFNGTADFDPGTETSNLAANGNTDGFVLKLDASGNFKWAKNYGGSGIDVSTAITVDANGNVFTTGINSANADFDPGTATFNILDQGAFVSKLDAGGNFLSAFGFTGAVINGIKTDVSGNIYTTGNFQGDVDLDPGTSAYNLKATVGGADVFLSKLSSTGKFIWARRVYSNSAESSNGLELDGSGNIFIVGKSYGSGLRVDGESSTISPGFAGDYMIILQFNEDGVLMGSNYLGGSDVIGKALALDKNSNVFTTGNFVLTSDFNPDAPVFDLTAVAFTDVFISKLKLSPYITTGLEEVESRINFQLYPNPTSSIVSIKIPEIGMHNHCKVVIYDLNGRLVLERPISNEVEKIDISNLEAGMYIFNISSDISKTTKRVVKY